MKDVGSPFTDEQVININIYQKNREYHPFTCCGEFCDRGEREDEGILIASNEGLACPCGLYKQDWCYAFMAEPQQKNKL
jgi:hypothetical protein